MRRTGIAALLFLGALAPLVSGQSRSQSTRPRATTTPRPVGRAIIIDHTRIEAVSELPPEVLARVGQRSFYFAHASVGGNIVDGLNALRAGDPARYSLTVRGAGDPPSKVAPGVVYQDDRGNPGWRGKIEHFRRRIDAGWRGPGLIAIDKFCYIDPDADWAEYTRGLSELERRYPDTVFVYTTMPLTRGEDEANIRRHAFNEAVRRWVRDHGAVLLDIADIEAHGPAGRPQTFQGSVPMLHASYTDDGGHLNGEGARRVALGFYALAAALADRDAP